ncbi:MAG: CRISPR-associated endonuclease Cas2 [bacterium]
MKRNKILDSLIVGLDKAITITEDIIYPYKGFDPRKLYRKNYNYLKANRNLEEKQYIEKIGKDKFQITLLGKLEILKVQNRKINFELKDWDGKWRILAFDIPEKKRRIREKLREYLIILGFKLIQKSIWITPQKIDFHELQPLFEEKIKEKLLFIITDKISEEKEMRKFFGLG